MIWVLSVGIYRNKNREVNVVVGFQKAGQSADFVHCLLGIMAASDCTIITVLFPFFPFLSYFPIYTIKLLRINNRSCTISTFLFTKYNIFIECNHLAFYSIYI